MDRPTFAAFDFDGTMTRRDTLLPFLVRVSGRSTVARALAAESPRLALAGAGRGDRDVVKERVLGRVLTGMAYADVETAGHTYAAELLRSAITREARDRIAWHRREGHDVVIVSASLDVYLLEIAEALGVSHVLATGLEVDDTGRCSGRLRGANCRGPEKATRLRALLEREPGAGPGVTLWAYGNSAGDDEMLALAQHPIRVRRGRVRAPARVGHR